MATTWTGAIDHHARNPGNWSNDLAPQPGDTLFVVGPATIDIKDNVLAGDQLRLGGEVTLNLSHHADANLFVNRFAGGLHPAGDVVANITGSDTVEAVVDGAIRQGPGKLTINLDEHARLHGSITIRPGASASISGNQDARYVHNETDVIQPFGNEIVDTSVVGSGVFNDTGGTLQFGGCVGVGQTIDLSFGLTSNVGSHPSLQVGDPKQFHAEIDLHDPLAAVDLIGLAKADSWSYLNDMLTIKGPRGNTIDTLHVINDTGSSHGLAVSKVGDDVLVGPGTGFSGSFGSHPTCI